jgi:hypothetical protein
MIAALCEGRCYEEQKREEVQDSDAPCPHQPSKIIAVSCEEIDAAEQEPTKKPFMSIEDEEDDHATAGKIAPSHEVEEYINSTQYIINLLMREISEIFSNNETPVNSESQEFCVPRLL